MTAFFKNPQMLNVDIQGVRGLAVQGYFKTPIFATAYRIYQNPIVKSQTVDLKPGEEVRILVTLPSHIPVDAEFVQLRPALLLQEGGSSADQRFQTSIVQEEDGSTKRYSVDITAPATATVLSVRLEDGDVFWTFTNPLIKDRYDMQDISQQTNQYLDAMLQARGNIETPIELPFLIESNTAAEVMIGLFAIDYISVKTQSWFNALDGTARVDRNMSLDFAQVEKISLDSPDNETREKLMELHLDIGGEFGRERLLGSTAPHDGIEMMTISGDYAIAQGIQLDTAIKCAGVCVLLQRDADIDLYTEIQRNENAMPASSNPLVQTTANLTVSPDQDSISWAFVPFESPVELSPDETYWVIFRGVQGVGRLAMQSQANTYLTRTLVNRGGQMWRPLHSGGVRVLPLLRCVYLPDIDNQSAAITLKLDGTDIQRSIDPQPEGQHLLFQIDEAINTPVRLIIESKARGDLSLANLMQKFKVSP